MGLSTLVLLVSTMQPFMTISSARAGERAGGKESCRGGVVKSGTAAGAQSALSRSHNRQLRSSPGRGRALPLTKDEVRLLQVEHDVQLAHVLKVLVHGLHERVDELEHAQLILHRAGEAGA